MGPSGSGKTTILKMIAGLSEASAGVLLLDGKDARLLPAWERGIGMVFQNGGLYPHLTVYQNIIFGLDRFLADKNKLAEEVEKTATLLGISELLERKPGELSGGQRQRAAIGRAIIRKPKILLMDEPLANLDPGLRRQLRDELMALKNRLDLTCIYVTHDQTEAMTMGDRVVLLNRGKIEQIGTPQSLYQQPENTFVASFFGDPPINYLFPEKLEKKNKQWGLSLLNRWINLENFGCGNWACDGQSVSELIVGIRPEAITLCNLDSDSAFIGELDYAQWLGADAILYLKCGKNKVIIRAKGEAVLPKGSRLAFDFSAAECYLFNKETNRRLDNG